MTTEDEMRRLAFIKYLYGVAVEQSRQPELMKAASILTFHDAVELFLILAAQRVKINPADVKFMQFWERLETRHVTLGHKEPMRILNELRNSLKHAGIRPGSSEVEAARANVSGFFQENTPLAFDGWEFSSISMVQLVQHQHAKNCLVDAERCMATQDLGGAIWMVTAAFHALVETCIHPGTEPDDSKFFRGTRLVDTDMTKVAVEDAAIRRMSDDVEALQQAVTVLSLGLDYQRYLRFRRFALSIEKDEPYVVDGKEFETIVTVADPRKEPPTFETCQFCFDFVIDSALRLQEFDFDTK